MSSTISVHEDVKQKLDALKVHPLESYNDIIVRMLDCYKAEELTEEDTQDIGQSLEDLKAKKVRSPGCGVLLRRKNKEPSRQHRSITSPPVQLSHNRGSFAFFICALISLMCSTHTNLFNLIH